MIKKMLRTALTALTMAAATGAAAQQGSWNQQGQMQPQWGQQGQMQQQWGQQGQQLQQQWGQQGQWAQPQQPQGQLAPHIAQLFNNTKWGLNKRGQLSVIDYFPNGQCRGSAGHINNGQMTPFTCTYQVRQIGPNRIALTVRPVLNGRALGAETNVLSLRQDGNMLNETIYAIALRLRPDGSVVRPVKGSTQM
ncbi:MAG: hypothetical protein AAGF44_09295 [Pseudomonadota bacterium]